MTWENVSYAEFAKRVEGPVREFVDAAKAQKISSEGSFRLHDAFGNTLVEMAKIVAPLLSPRFYSDKKLKWIRKEFVSFVRESTQTQISISYRYKCLVESVCSVLTRIMEGELDYSSGLDETKKLVYTKVP